MAAAYYIVRYLEPGQAGLGEIVKTVGTDKELTLSDIKTAYPSTFEPEGFYSLMKATGETITTQKKDKK